VQNVCSNIHQEEYYSWPIHNISLYMLHGCSAGSRKLSDARKPTRSSITDTIKDFEEQAQRLGKGRTRRQILLYNYYLQRIFIEDISRTKLF